MDVVLRATVCIPLHITELGPVRAECSLSSVARHYEIDLNYERRAA